MAKIPEAILTSIRSKGQQITELIEEMNRLANVVNADTIQLGDYEFNILESQRQQIIDRYGVIKTELDTLVQSLP